jgi:O-antigen/teichoic acid export membrane protein
MLRSALLILSGNSAASLLLLARNLIVARLIPVEDYGVAATFAVAMAVVEMVSALGLQQQIVQAKEGEDPRFQAALQGFQLLRGILSGALLFFIAVPMADFLGIPEAAWAYQVLAVVPVLNALVHFDIYRLNRQMRFWPLMLTGGIPALLSLLAVWPLARWFGDWQVMLWAILLQAGIAAVTSHLVAERRWQLVFDRAIIGRSLRFGWPLLANGVLLFLVFNGEKLIIGRELGMAALGIFAMGVTLTLTPTLVMARSAQNFFLPQLAPQTNDPGRFVPLALATLQTVQLFAVLLAMVTFLAGGAFIVLVLGEKYNELVELLTWLAILQSVRMLKAGPAIVALAMGRTGNALVGNLFRVLALPLCWLVAVGSGDLRLIIWIALLAEFIGYCATLWMLRPQLRLRMQGILMPNLAIALVLLVMAASTLWVPTTSDLAPSTHLALALVGVVLPLLFMKELREYARFRKDGF